MKLMKGIADGGLRLRARLAFPGDGCGCGGGWQLRLLLLLCRRRRGIRRPDQLDECCCCNSSHQAIVRATGERGRRGGKGKGGRVADTTLLGNRGKRDREAERKSKIDSASGTED